MTSPTPHDITSAEKLVAELRSGADGWEIAVADEIRLYGDGTEDAIGMQARADMYRRAAALIESQRAELADVRESLHYANGTADLAIKHRDAAEARVTALEAEKAGTVKLADGYGIVLMMIAAGCSDPQRFAKRMLAEYAPEAKKMEATK